MSGWTQRPVVRAGPSESVSNAWRIAAGTRARASQPQPPGAGDCIAKRTIPAPFASRKQGSPSQGPVLGLCCSGFSHSWCSAAFTARMNGRQAPLAILVHAHTKVDLGVAGGRPCTFCHQGRILFGRAAPVGFRTLCVSGRNGLRWETPPFCPRSNA